MCSEDVCAVDVDVHKCWCNTSHVKVMLYVVTSRWRCWMTLTGQRGFTVEACRQSNPRKFQREHSLRE